MSEDLDRSHAATPYKLENARERGQVAKSADAVSAVVFTTAMVFLTWHGWETWRAVLGVARGVLAQAQAGLEPGALWPMVHHSVRETLVLGAPFLGALVLSAVLANLLQSGPVLSLEPLAPDWSRISPATGLRRVFSMRTLFQAARALLKLGLLLGVSYLALRSLAPQLRTVAQLAPLGMTRVLLADVARLGLQIALMLALIALVDLIYTRREFAKQMRMSHRELKDEIKHREGDPRVRARHRELRRELLKRTLSLRKTRDADVLVTNPTHYAVALRYVHGEMPSPQLVAKGAGKLAATMRAIAARHQIPVVQNPPLARRLYRELPVDQHVPSELYAQVARIIVWVFALRDARGAGARASVDAARRPIRAAGRPAWTS